MERHRLVGIITRQVWIRFPICTGSLLRYSFRVKSPTTAPTPNWKHIILTTPDWPKELVIPQQDELPEDAEPIQSSTATDETWEAHVVEGSRASFAHCLKRILGDMYGAFDSERQEQEARVLVGNALDARSRCMRRWIRWVTAASLCSHAYVSAVNALPAAVMPDFMGD